MKKLIIFIMIIAVSLTMTSCYTQGYGCKGNSRIMTRVR